MNRPLNATDAALWDIERDPTLRTTIVAVLHLERPIDRDRLVNDLEAATRIIPKLRQRVVEGPAGMGTPHWELINDFDIADHVDFVETAEAPDDKRILQVSEELASSPLDRSGALWSCTYLGGRSGRSVVLLKVHHSLTDGVGGMELLDAILDAQSDAEARDLDDFPIPESTGSIHPLLAATNSAQKLADLQLDVAKLAVGAASHPLDTATGLWKGVQSTLRLLSPVSSTMSTLMTGRSPDRHAHTFDLDLEQMHVAAHKHSCTINHLLFAGVIEGIAAYHRHSDHEVEGLRVLMPVSFRTSDGTSSGNEWGPVRFTAPAAIKDPVDRLRAMRTVLARSGNEPALEFSQQLAGAVQLLPSALSSSIVSGMMHGVDLVVTNIPGLQDERFLCGSQVDRVYAFAPTGGAALNVALLSHQGRACVGILSDAAAIELPDTLQKLIAESLRDVIEAAENTDAVPFVEAAPTPKVVAGSSRRLSALDTSFLELETPEAPMQLGAVIIVDGQPLRNEDGTIRLDSIRQHIQARLSRVPNFRRKLAEVPLGFGRPLWVDDEDFDISRHVRTVAVARPGSEQDVLDLAATLHETPLDRNHPLWEIWLVDGLADGNIALVKKVHHALVDGVGAVELIAALFDPEPLVAPDVPLPVRTRPTPSPARRIADAAFEQLVDPLRLARSTTQMILSPNKAIDQARSLAAAASDVLRPSAVAPSSSFNQPIERLRSLQSLTIELAGLDEARHKADASVNDLVLAVIAGAFQRWLPLHGDNVFDVHAVVPVSVHDDGISGTRANQVGAVLLTLPVREPDPDRRLELVRDRMRRLKRSHDGEGLALILEALDYVPARSLRAARLLSLQRLANLVITNVPGPREPMYFLGAEAVNIIPILPLGPNLGLGVAITSYRDRLTLGLFADPNLCPDLDVLAQALEAEFKVYL